LEAEIPAALTKVLKGHFAFAFGIEELTPGSSEAPIAASKKLPEGDYACSLRDYLFRKISGQKLPRGF
jgi:hypothetical protein